MKYKTGDLCPITGKWFCEESEESIEIKKGDVFSSYLTRRTHWVLIDTFTD